jgi:hypothetical protein
MYWLEYKNFCCCPSRGAVINDKIIAINPKPQDPNSCKLFVKKDGSDSSSVILNIEDFLEENNDD